MKSRFLYLIFAIGLSTGYALSDDAVITVDLIRNILDETSEAALQNDFHGVTKYYYPESIVVYDLDPDPKSKKYELGYEEFMPKMKLDLAAMQEADSVEDEILSIKVHPNGLTGEAITRTKIVRFKKGVRTEVVGDIKVLFKIINGEVKIAREEVELLKLEKSDS